MARLAGKILTEPTLYPFFGTPIGLFFWDSTECWPVLALPLVRKMISPNNYDNYPQAENVKPIERNTNQIVLLDDGLRSGSMIARYILLNCNEFRQSCALYHLGPGAAPQLTYYEPGEPLNSRRYNQRSGLDFAVFVAATPRHALTWLEEHTPRSVTVVMDVNWHNDRDVGLSKLLATLAEAEIATQLIFTSGDPQNYRAVRALVDQNKASFVVKGSQEWSTLSRRLVETASRADYYTFRRAEVS